MRTTAAIIDAAVAAKAGFFADEKKKNEALFSMADCLCAAEKEILEANRADVTAAQGKISAVMIDRLTLTPARIADMAEGIRAVAALPDPVGQVLSEVKRPNGLLIRKVRVPLGVVAIIYESRPNVTSDAAALCVKSGNVALLRGGREAAASAAAIVKALRAGLFAAGLSPDIVSRVEDTSRESARELMTAAGKIDLLIPRGGRGLIRACVENATVPTIETGTGICHIYVDESADFQAAVKIVENAKASRPSVCNAEEVLLVHEKAAPVFLPMLRKALTEDRVAAGLLPVSFRADPAALPFVGGTPAGPADFDTEFLDYILAVGVVKNKEEAVAHIAAHGTHHSDAILTRDEAAAGYFLSRVDSAAVYVNASTRFTDGGEFGLGCEMGISTQKLHARGPMGLAELTTYKYQILGNGQIR